MSGICASIEIGVTLRVLKTPGDITTRSSSAWCGSRIPTVPGMVDSSVGTPCSEDVLFGDRVKAPIYVDTYTLPCLFCCCPLNQWALVLTLVPARAKPFDPGLRMTIVRKFVHNAEYTFRSGKGAGLATLHFVDRDLGDKYPSHLAGST